MRFCERNAGVSEAKGEGLSALPLPKRHLLLTEPTGGVLLVVVIDRVVSSNKEEASVAMVQGHGDVPLSLTKKHRRWTAAERGENES